MTNEEAQKVLDELQNVRPEVLNDEAKRLFEAIMKIADERDLLKEKTEKQEEIIQAMAGKISEYKDYLEGIPEDDMWHEECFLYNKISDCYAYNDCEKCIIEFYSKKVGE